ncbi:MAG: GNAT family N-acetyltransferase [Anaerolineae bacterium]|nr:GNAT family N-acetyltransferase [Anaerolineae bacterium]
MLPLPPDFPPITLRRARAEDQAAIRRMVYAARLDPTRLHWSHFVVVEVLDGDIIGVGQVRPHRWCRELGSLVVDQAWRGRGVGAQIVRALLAGESGPVYLECAGRMAYYYTRFGFAEIPWWRAPLPLSIKAGPANLVARLLGRRIVVMRRD